MKTVQILVLSFLLVSVYSCKKEIQDKNNSTVENIEVGAFQYMPMHFGSRWTFKVYDINTDKKFKGYEYHRYDSTTNAIYIYNNSKQLISYAFWYRSLIDKNTMLFGQNLVLFNLNYVDSIKNKRYVINKDSNYTNYILGGIDSIDTKFGKVPCITIGGESHPNYTYVWKRIFGKGIGVVKEESYYHKNNDTLNHELSEIDSYFINRP